MKRFTFCVVTMLLLFGFIEPVSANSGSDYLIITHDNFYDHILPLKNLKEEKGYLTKVVKTSEIGNHPTADEIANYIANEYNTQSPKPKYVLLVGDVEYIPTHYRNDSEGDSFPTDLYYATMNSDDYLPDICVGRLPVNNNYETDRIVSKILNYIPANNKVLCFGAAAEMQYVEWRHKSLLESNGFVVDTAIDTDSTDIINRINEGRLLVAYYGHGNYESAGPLYSRDLDQLTNTEELSVVLSGGCNNNEFDRTWGRKCLGENFLLGEAGAIAFVGSTREGGYGYHYRFADGFYNELSNSGKIGKMLDAGRCAAYDAAVAGGQDVGEGSFTKSFIEKINLLGDPDICCLRSEEFYHLSGTLTNTDGDPVPGWVYASETTGANLGNQVYTSNGTYEMALFPGNYNVYAYVYTYYSQGSTRIRTQTQNITINQDSNLDIKELAYSLYHLTGKVMDTNGVGIANVAIRANHNSGDCYANITTNSDGTYDLLLLDGTYSLYFTPPADSTFLEEKIYDFQISENATHNVFLNSSEHTLSGILIDTNQNPASGWWVYANEVNGADYKHFWYSDGTYQMSLLPSTYKVYAYAYTFYYSPNYSYTGIKTSYQTVSISGNTSCDIEVPLHDSYHLTGKVTDTSSVAQPNVEITANDSSYTYSAYTTTDSGGNYDLLLPPGTYKLTIKAPPATYPPFEIKKLTIAGDSVRNIRLSLEYTLLEEALSLLPDDLDIALDVFDIIDQADALNYDIFVQGAKGLLQIILNWAGSEMKVTLYDPNGNVYGEYQSTEPPINVGITNPTEGTWKCEVTAVDVPHDNYPFALVAGISPNESPVADANGSYSGAVDSPITFDASGSYDPDGDIVSYEWDWDGDGNFDESTDLATITHTWNEPYSGTIVLRVKDNEGATSTDSGYVEVGAGSLTAEVDINPDVLNPKSKGNWVTSYIELPEGYAAENIDVSTVTLEGIISAESSPTQVGDHDDDGIPDLMVKFDRQVLIGYLEGATGEVTLTLMGDVDGKPFEGSDTIIVIGKGKE